MSAHSWFLPCPCFSCVILTEFQKHRYRPRYRMEAYGILMDLFGRTYLLKKQKTGLPMDDPNLMAKLSISCKDVLDHLPEVARMTMGDLAPMVFEILELHHTRNLEELIEDLIKIRIVPNYSDPNYSDNERFTDYDVNLPELIRNQ